MAKIKRSDSDADIFADVAGDKQSIREDAGKLPPTPPTTESDVQLSSKNSSATSEKSTPQDQAKEPQLEQSTQPSKPTKKKRAAPARPAAAVKRPRVTKPKKKAPVAVEPAVPRKSTLNKVMVAKVCQIRDFIDAGINTDEGRKDRFDRQSAGTVMVTETVLIGALMAMRADWEVDHPTKANKSDVQNIIVREEFLPLGSTPVMVNYVTLDLQEQSEIEKVVQEKVMGWGLDGSNLLQVELELYRAAAEKYADGLQLRHLPVAGEANYDTSSSEIDGEDLEQPHREEGDTDSVEGETDSEEGETDGEEGEIDSEEGDTESEEG